MYANPQAQTSELRRLISKFEPITAAEQELLQQAPTENMADCRFGGDDDPKDADKWGKNRRIRAKLLAWLCTNEQARKHVHPSGVWVRGADISGPLKLLFVKIPFHWCFGTAVCLRRLT